MSALATPTKEAPTHPVASAADGEALIKHLLEVM